VGTVACALLTLGNLKLLSRVHLDLRAPPHRGGDLDRLRIRALSRDLLMFAARGPRLDLRTIAS